MTKLALLGPKSPHRDLGRLSGVRLEATGGMNFAGIGDAVDKAKALAAQYACPVGQHYDTTLGKCVPDAEQYGPPVPGEAPPASGFTANAVAAPASTVTSAQSAPAPTANAAAGFTGPGEAPTPKEGLLARYGDLLGLHHPAQPPTISQLYAPGEAASNAAGNFVQGQIGRTSPAQTSGESYIQRLRDLAGLHKSTVAPKLTDIVEGGPAAGKVAGAGVRAVTNPVNVGLMGAGAPLELGVKPVVGALGKEVAANALMGSSGAASTEGAKALGAPPIVQSGAGFVGGFGPGLLKGGIKGVVSNIVKSGGEETAATIKQKAAAALGRELTSDEAQYIDALPKGRLGNLAKEIPAASTSDIPGLEASAAMTPEQLRATQSASSAAVRKTGGQLKAEAQGLGLSTVDKNGKALSNAKLIENLDRYKLGQTASQNAQEAAQTVQSGAAVPRASGPTDTMLSEMGHAPGTTPTLPSQMAPRTPKVTPENVPTRPEAPTTAAPKLSRDLQGAKPRYNYGTQGAFTPAFASDIEKAAFITAQATKSKRDADYLNFVMKATGMSESEVRAYGQQVRNGVKAAAKDAIAKGQTTGDLVVPSVQRPNVTAARTPLVAEAPPENVVPMTPRAPQDYVATPEGGLKNVTEAQGLSGDKLPPPPTTGTQAGLEGIAPEPPNNNTFAQNMKSLLSAPKQIQASGDILGSSFRQNMPEWFISPDIAAKNVSRSWRSYFSDANARSIMDEIAKSPGFERTAFTNSKGELVQIPGMKDVLGIGSDFQTPGFENVGKTTVQSAIERFPGYAQGERAYRVALVGNATDQYARDVQAALKAGIEDPSWFKYYADTAKVAAGYGDVPQKLKGFQNEFYSLRNVAARFQFFTKPLTNPGPVLRIGSGEAGAGLFSASPRGVAARNLFRFMGGETANLMILAGAAHASGLPIDVGWNPVQGDYGKVSYTDNEGNQHNIDMLGGFGSMIRASARTALTVKQRAAGETPTYDPIQEWIKFGRYKMSPIPAAAIDTTLKYMAPRIGHDFGSSFFDPSKVSNWLSFALPFFSSDQIQAVVDGTLKQPEDLGLAGANMLLQWLGLPGGLQEPYQGSQAGSNWANPFRSSGAGSSGQWQNPFR